ncbi:MAG: SDR family oxidoreductase [Dehalococcoidales bacterium]|nr:SDR family oxidoreductase [Dehalococcoidales bacterium]
MGLQTFSLEGKVALVTGAASVRGIGRTIALAFADAGADVAVCDLNVKGSDYDIEDTADEIRKLGRRALSLQADVTDRTSVTSLFERVVQELGTVDILVNNAGICGYKPFLEDNNDHWDKMMAVNLKGCFLCSQAAAKIMIERKKGSIVNIASISGMRAISTQFIYGISKSGVIQLTKELGLELAPHNIRANAVAPGLIDTNIPNHKVEGSINAPNKEGFFKRAVERIPLGRIGKPSDIANVALFLASDASAFVTGQTIVADGGVTVTL